MLMLWMGLAHAQTEPAPEIPRHRLYYESLAGVRMNPVGLQERFTLGYRVRLMDRPSDDLLFGDTYAWFAVTGIQTPAFMRVGPWVRVSPIALLRLQAGYELVRFHGGFDQIMTWDSPVGVDWSDDAREARGEAGDNYQALGSVLTLEARIQAKVGPVAVRTTVAGYRFDHAVPDGDVAFYDQSLDILASTNGWVLSNDLDALYFATEKVFLGGRYTHTRSRINWPADSIPVDGTLTDDNADWRIHRVGPLVAWQFRQAPGSHFDAMTVYVISQWHVTHPYRDGTDVSRGVPYLAVGFAFGGDAIRWDG